MLTSNDVAGHSQGINTPTIGPQPSTPFGKVSLSSVGSSAGGPSYLSAGDSQVMIAVEPSPRGRFAFGSQQKSSVGSGLVSGTFDCPRCRKRFPLSDATMVGNQQWCILDKRSHSALQTRWQKNAKLRTWWLSLSPDAQATYYLKWQSLSTKDRFKAMLYCETVALSMEDIGDEIDDHIPLDTYCIRHLAKFPGTPHSTMEADFLAIVSACRSECLYRRDQWLIPVFEWGQADQTQTTF